MPNNDIQSQQISIPRLRSIHKGRVIAPEDAVYDEARARRLLRRNRPSASGHRSGNGRDRHLTRRLARA